MNNNFFWKLCLFIVAGSIALYWLIDILSNHAEMRMSHIAEKHQKQILAYASEAENLYLKDDLPALTAYMKHIQQKENTWASIVESNLTTIADTKLSQRYLDEFTLGRSVSWKIHLYFENNPVMGVVFENKTTHFLIQLPARMRPGSYLKATSLLLKIIMPVVLLSILAALLYRHMMGPLRRLERASRRLSKGDFTARAYENHDSRHDEFTHVTQTFDSMAQRIGKMVCMQREFIADFSHELRTPITRIEMALACAQTNINSKEMLDRIALEVKGMRKLAEDSLTLAWLENEAPKVTIDPFDLIDLLDSILDDGCFEFPEKKVTRELPESLIFYGNSRLLGQAIENIVRNALRYAIHEVTLAVDIKGDLVILKVSDDGEGVAEKYLTDIFKPFYRVADKNTEYQNSGFGLGLALAQRQIVACNGDLSAENKASGGLCITIQLPNVCKVNG